MQAIVETLFDAVYLISVITIGVLMIRASKGNAQFKLFGLMAVVLGAGASFHLVPRALALCTTGLENYTVPLGLGKWITSITMTVFYVLLGIISIPMVMTDPRSPGASIATFPSLFWAFSSSCSSTAAPRSAATAPSAGCG